MAINTDQVDTGLAGVYIASLTSYMIYGKDSRYKLIDVLGKIGGSRVFVVTGNTLYEKTPVIKEIQAILGDRHVFTFYQIRQHTPISDIEKCIDIAEQARTDAILSVGGGSAIDAGKAISYFMHLRTGTRIPNIAMPTTLSAAETTQIAGYTGDDGHKTAVVDPTIVPRAIIYDGEIAIHTPNKLWVTSGLRALDHALELLYHPTAPEVPSKRLALVGIADLFAHLPRSTAGSQDLADVRQILLLAAYSSLFPHGLEGNVLFTGGTGLSHSIGNALGATYGIPHGITSCITLAAVVRLKAAIRSEEARCLARAVEAVGSRRTGDATVDATTVGDAVYHLVEMLGLKTTLTECGVPPNQEEIIAERALPGGRDHPDFVAVVDMIRGIY